MHALENSPSAHTPVVHSVGNSQNVPLSNVTSHVPTIVSASTWHHEPVAHCVLQGCPSSGGSAHVPEGSHTSSCSQSRSAMQASPRCPISTHVPLALQITPISPHT